MRKGKAKGVEAIRVETGAGLSGVLLVDRALDLGDVRLQRTFALLAQATATPRTRQHVEPERPPHQFRLIALIDQAAVIQRILRHLGEPAEVPVPRPSRAPPLFDNGWENHADAFDPSA